jgi:hypothetical protein
MPDRVRPVNFARPYCSWDGLGVAEVLHDLERSAQREHLRFGDVLDEVGEQLQVAVVCERDAKCVGRLLLGLLVPRAEGGQSGLDLDPVPPQAVLEVKVTRRVRVRELVAHDEVAVLGAPVQRVVRGVRAAVLHRLQHPRHLVADRVLGASR